MNKLNLKLRRDIGAQKWQFTALVLIILLGVTTYGGMIGMIDDVEASLDRTLDELAFQDFVVQFEGLASEDVAQRVAALDNVGGVTARLVVDAGLYISDDNQARARLVGMPAGSQPAVNQLYIQEGRYLEESDGLVAVLDHHLAEYYGYGPETVMHPIVDGQRLDVRIVGVGVSPEYLMAVASSENPLPSPSGFAVLFVPQDELQSLLGAEGAINELNVLLTDQSPARVDEAIASVRRVAGDTAIRSVVKRADNPSYELLRLDLEGGREMMGMVPSMFLMIAAMSIYVSLSRMVQAQRSEIGVLKALGYTRRAVMRYYLLYAGLIAAIGAALGFLFSYATGRLFAQAYAAEFGLPFVVVRFHLEAAVEAIGISLFVAILAGFFPARASARIAPAQAMRFDPSVALVKGVVPWPERLIRHVVSLGTGTKIALRNLFRNRRRTLTTGLGFVFGFVVLLACWAMFDGMDHMMDIQFEDTDVWDLQVTFSQVQFDAVRQEVASWTGVQAVEAVIALPATLHTGSEEKDVFLAAVAPDTVLHGFQVSDAQEPAELLAPGKALLPQTLGKDLDIAAGDVITVETPFGSRQLIADASNGEVMSQSIYVSLDWLREEMLGGAEVLSALWLKVDEDTGVNVRRDLYGLPGVASVDLKSDIAAGWRALMGLYYVMMGAFLLFALVIAGAVVFNTMTVNVLERQREIATMRALGQSRRRLWYMITLENMLVGALALVPGLALGAGSAYYLFQAFGAAEFYLPFYIAPESYAIVTILICATALLTQLPAMRRIGRMNLAEATKVMT